jgi:predicted PurR-regulated permease PerM
MDAIGTDPSPAPPPPARAALAPATPADEWTRPATRWLALLAATVIVLYLCWLMLAPFVDVLLWAVVLVVVFHPVHLRLAARVKSPSLAAGISCLIVIVTILLPLALVTVAVVRDATAVAQTFQERKGELLDPNSPTALGRALRWVDQYVDIDRVRSQQYLAQRAAALSGQIAARTLNVVGGVVGVLVQVFFVIFTMFYLFRDADQLRAGLRRLLPLDRWQAHEVFLRTKEVIRASIYGSLVIATVQGTLGAVAFWVLGVPSPILWGAVMILLCMIPMAGAFLVWVPAALYLLSVGKWPHAAGLAVWGALVIGTIDNVLRPRLVGGRTRMHELVIFFSVLGGLQVFGVLGIVTGPAVAAIALALVEVWRRAKPTTAPPAPAVGARTEAGVSPVEPPPTSTPDPAPAPPPPAPVDTADPTPAPRVCVGELRPGTGTGDDGTPRSPATGSPPGAP